MARFLKHVACERCGSSDAKGLYDDGSSWCFSCRRGNGADVCSLVAAGKLKTEVPLEIEAFHLIFLIISVLMLLFGLKNQG